MTTPLAAPSETNAAPISPARFFAAWLGFGIQSFGGGSVVLALMRQVAVEREQWVTDLEFTRDWALVQMAPGINLVGFAILIARRVDGFRGVALGLIGLLLPSASITMLLTALYAHFAEVPIVHAAMRGLLPATVGLGIITSWKMVTPVLREANREGRSAVFVALLVLGGCGLGIALFPRLPVVSLLLTAAVVSAVARWLSVRTPPEENPSA